MRPPGNSVAHALMRPSENGVAAVPMRPPGVRAAARVQMRAAPAFFPACGFCPWQLLTALPQPPPSQMLGMSSLCAYVLWLQSFIPLDSFRKQSLGDAGWNQIVGASVLLAMMGLPVRQPHPGIRNHYSGIE